MPSISLKVKPAWIGRERTQRTQRLEPRQREQNRPTGGFPFSHNALWSAFSKATRIGTRLLSINLVAADVRRLHLKNPKSEIDQSLLTSAAAVQALKARSLVSEKSHPGPPLHPIEPREALGLRLVLTWLPFACVERHNGDSVAGAAVKKVHSCKVNEA
jgi:hypothetical protein